MVQERNRNVKFTLPTTSTIISEQLGFDSQRVFISIINTSTGGETVSLGIEDEAKAGQGIVLSPGGTYSESADGINFPTNAQFTALGSANTATIALAERIRRG